MCDACGRRALLPNSEDRLFLAARNFDASDPDVIVEKELSVKLSQIGSRQDNSISRMLGRSYSTTER